LCEEHPEVFEAYFELYAVTSSTWQQRRENGRQERVNRIFRRR